MSEYSDSRAAPVTYGPQQQAPESPRNQVQVQGQVPGRLLQAELSAQIPSLDRFGRFPDQLPTYSHAPISRQLPSLPPMRTAPEVGMLSNPSYTPPIDLQPIPYLSASVSSSLASSVGPSSTAKPKASGGGKVFQCTDYPGCNMAFSRGEHLARHIRKHTGASVSKCRF